MEKFNTYNNLGGKNAFSIFLKIIDEIGYKFNSQNYMNVGTYSYFYQTDKIKDKQLLLDIFEYKKSIPCAYGTLKKLTSRISFYFAIKEYQLEYGFFDIDKEMIYKIGTFTINTQYIKSLSNKCLYPIKSTLRKVLLKYVILLHKVKPQLNIFKGYDNDIKIVDEFRIRCSYDKNIFNVEDLNYDRMNSHINRWLIDNNLNKTYVGHATISEDKVNFFIKIKEKKHRTYNPVTKSFN